MVQHRDNDHVWSRSLSLSMLKQKQKAGAFLLSPRRCQGGFFFFWVGGFRVTWVTPTASREHTERRWSLKLNTESDRSDIWVLLNQKKNKMGKLFLFLLIFVLCLTGTLQKKGKRSLLIFTQLNICLQHFWYINCCYYLYVTAYMCWINVINGWAVHEESDWSETRSYNLQETTVTVHCDTLIATGDGSLSFI